MRQLTCFLKTDWKYSYAQDKNKEIAEVKAVDSCFDYQLYAELLDVMGDDCRLKIVR